MIESVEELTFDSEFTCSNCKKMHVRHKVKIVANHIKIKVTCPKCGELEESLTSLGWIAERIYEKSTRNN